MEVHIRPALVELCRSIDHAQLFYDKYGIPDQLQIIYEGVVIFGTGGLVSYSATNRVNVPAGSATTVTVRVFAPNVGTAWEYVVSCP